ncbi:MAG TPA: glycerol-3-phosphate dehydrogenase/oxidase [Ktedonobacterales bacterium]|nr:glycerol-3-phosphate dehydrogenase/oxidase [Ktedonobacterales bacterium]
MLKSTLITARTLPSSSTAMEPLSSTVRMRNLARMKDERFDVLVIGGGVTGAGVAVDAAARGYRVALVEKTDFASGTSSKSTKLVHGGIRYLPNFDFALVREALTERGILLKNAPFLVEPVGFVLPLYKGDRHPVGLPLTTPGGIGLRYVLSIGLWLYDLLAGGRNVQRHRHLSRADVLRMAPTLVQEGLKEGFIYYDAQTHDARLTMALIRTAAQHGADIANYAEVISFVTEQGKVTGAVVRDHIGNQEFTIQARHIINATGIFSEEVESLTGKEPQVSVEPSKGVHLVLSREQIKVDDFAVVLPETDDRRILFIVPWGSRAIFGTTDTGSGDLNHPLATQKDISYLLEHLNRYLSINLTTDDIISAYAGYRPLVRPGRGSKHSPAKLSRTHAVLESPSGLVTIVGGKMTTYRRMAQDTVDVLSRRDGTAPIHPTERLLLYGGTGWPDAQHQLQVKGASLGLSAKTISHLAKSYGAEAAQVLKLIEGDASLAQPLIDDLPYIRAEVVHACRAEMAMTPYDVLARRTSITLEDYYRGMNVVGTVAGLMAKELGWSSERQQALIGEFQAAIGEELAAEATLELPSH